MTTLVQLVAGTVLGVCAAGCLGWAIQAIFDALGDALGWHPIRRLIRLWRSPRLRKKYRPDPVYVAAIEAKTAIENYRHTKRVRHERDAIRWVEEFKALDPDPVPVEAQPKKKAKPSTFQSEPHQVVRSADGGVRIVDQYGTVIARY